MPGGRWGNAGAHICAPTPSLSPPAVTEPEWAASWTLDQDEETLNSGPANAGHVSGVNVRFKFIHT